MDHNQALEQMASERYLLNELAPEARDAFEEHIFDCPACALDLRAAAAFVDEARAQLPAMVSAPPLAGPVQPDVAQPRPVDPMAIQARPKRNRWFAAWPPLFAVPAFAALLLVLGYQNLVTLPALRSQATSPRLLAWAPLHGATRGGPATTVTAARSQGLALPIDLSPLPGAAPFASYAFELLDAQGKQLWTGAIPAPAADDNSSQRVLLAIPGAALRSGSYTVAVYGIGPAGDRTSLDRYAFNLEFAP